MDRYTVLIVDDNAANLKVMVNYLREIGFRILTATSGESALARARLAQPDIILLDVMMPGLDGFETCRRLKAEEKLRDIPVIFLTALSGVKEKIRGFQVGAVDYVTKPVQQEEMVARLQTHLTVRDLTRRLQKRNNQLQQTNTDLQQANRSLQQANALLSRRAMQLETSNQVGQQVTSLLDVNELLAAVSHLIQVRFGYHFIGIWLVDKEEESLVLQASAGKEENHSLPPDSHIALSMDESIIVDVFDSGDLYLNNNIHRNEGRVALQGRSKTRSELVLPLRFGHKHLGVLDIQSWRPQAFDEEDETVLQTLANQIAVAIRNAQLYELAEKRAHYLAELNARKDKFFSIMAHDLKGPFTSLLGNSELFAVVAPDLAPKDSRKLAQGIHHSAQNVYNLLHNLLEWSQLQLGHREYRPAYLKLRSVMVENLALLADQAVDKEITLHNTIPGGLLVYTDRNILNTVIRNLASNALKFTPSGGAVTISAHPADSSPDMMAISISDTGIGISPKDMKKLFRLDVVHTTKGTAKEEGTGLGLIICQEMIKQIGGEIWVESTEGEGTTFTFTVPIAASDLA